MRFLAGAIVVLAGSLLWAVGALAVSWASIGKGHSNSGELATYGGMVIVVAGGMLLYLAHTALPDKRDEKLFQTLSLPNGT